MILRPPRSTRTDTLFPYTALFRSVVRHGMSLLVAGRINDTTRPVVPESERFQTGSLKPGGNGMPDVILDIASFAARSALVRASLIAAAIRDQQNVVQGKSVSVRVDLGGRRIIKKK